MTKAKAIVINLFAVLISFSAVSTATTRGAQLIAEGPHPDAPAEVKQYGTLQGDWSCDSSSRQADGSW